ncbi:hypothetical protein D1BOALGB6SA_5121 [Olavius sp. associated proteobacterium Delta 1]|nr:hypothetical protein D1BOALGB6SA_5121 [Olavius sp. associated proteobacterium Delta 1]
MLFAVIVLVSRMEGWNSGMKRKSFMLLIIFMAMPMAAGFAQNPVSVIDSLGIEIWPDYDKASVLVLLTGALPEDTRLPASVTLPFPEAARLNAVARIDRKDGNMKDDIFSSTDVTGALTFVTPDLSFRVEYYLPYTVNKTQRTFDYTWLAAVTVNNFQLRVQRPTSASTFKTEPAIANVVRSGDGFDYHTFPTRAVPAGQSFSLQVDYKMANTQLSAESLPSPNTNVQPPALPATPGSGSGINWAWVAVVIGGLIIIAALIWSMASRRPLPNIRKPADERVIKQSRSKFCRNCGEPIDEDDKFCSGCGSEL